MSLVLSREWLVICVFGAAIAMGSGAHGALRNADDLFLPHTIWTVYLAFEPEQWEAMEPRREDGGFGRGLFGGPRGGPQEGSDANASKAAGVLARSLMRQADQDRDGQVSAAEIDRLAGRWFDAWDKSKSDGLGVEQIRDALNAMLAPPGLGPPLGFAPGLNLQGPEGKRNNINAAMGIDFPFVHADVEFAGQTFRDVGVRYKGGGTYLESQGGIKRPLKINFNRNVKGQKLAGLSQLNLHNNVTDASWMNEVLSYRLYRDAGVPAPRTVYARVYVTVPGKYDRRYFGLYSLAEEVDAAFAFDRFGTKDGAIFKPVSPHLFADLGDDWKAYHQTYDPKTGLSGSQMRRMMDFCWLVTQAEDVDFARRLGDFVELDEFARFMAVMVFLSDLDSILGLGHNFFLHLDPKTERFVFVPWDQDHSFGQFILGTQDQRERLSIHQPWQGQNWFLERIFKVAAFKKRYLARLEEFSKTIFKPERFHQQVDSLATVLRPAVRDESPDKLDRFEKVVAGEAFVYAGFGGGQRMNPIKPFVIARSRSVLDQLAGKEPGEVIAGFGIPGFGFPGFGGPRRGPGTILAPAFVAELDANQDGHLARPEFTAGFGRWFERWDRDKRRALTAAQLRAGVEQIVTAR